MKVIAKSNGQKTELEVNDQAFTAIVHQNGIKVEVPDAFEINSTTTKLCMEKMSEKQWEWISTGPLFQHLFQTLFNGIEVTLPARLYELLEDYDEGVIHGCGLIVLLVEEAIFHKNPKIFVKLPETNLHPRACQNIGSLFIEVQKLSGAKP